MLFYISWSPKEGEATYTRFFMHRSERDVFAAGIEHIAASVKTWERSTAPEQKEEK